jgi:hypothetical protein
MLQPGFRERDDVELERAVHRGIELDRAVR